MLTSEFRYVITSLYQSGSTPNPIIAELSFTGVSYTQQLNSVGTFQGHLLLSGSNSDKLNTYNATLPGKNILWVLYTDPDSLTTTAVWSGVIWAREFNSTTQTLGISAQEMMSLYNRRRISTTKDYSNTNYDPAYIAYNLMQYAESLPHGNTGLTYNSNTTIYATKKIYNGYELKSVYQAIKDLSSNYYDFKIAPIISGNSLINRFTIGSSVNPIGTTYSTTSLIAPVFQLPGNLIGYRYPEDASGAANRLYGLGYGVNDKKIIAIATDTNKIGTSGTWPLLEDSASYTDIGDLQLLKDLTLGQLNAISYPPTTIEVVIPTYVDPYYPSYNVGDQVRLDIQDDYFPTAVNGTILRVMAISVSPGETGPSRVTLTLTRLLESGTVS